MRSAACHHSLYTLLFTTALLTVTLEAAIVRADDGLEQIEKQQQALFEKISSAVVFIATDTGFGSGFFVDDAGLVLTNAHVVQGFAQVHVVLADGRRVYGQVVERASGDIDLALLKIPVQHTPALQLVDVGELRVGAWVATVGHGRGGIWSFNTGMVSNIYPDGVERPVFQTQIPLNPGSSGGPIVDRLGRVIGIVTAALKDSQGMNFAIRSDRALHKLRLLSGRCACLTVNLPPGVVLFVDGKMAGIGPQVVVQVAPGFHDVSAVLNGKMKRLKVRYPEEKTTKLEP